MTMGWLRPLVLFPAVLLSGLSAAEIELLLAHELAHVRRWDYLANLLQTVVETIFFYHPAAWWVSRRMRQERENACDDAVAARSGEALAYAKVLLRLETLRPPDVALAAAANGGHLLRRVQRLLGEPAPAFAPGLPSLLTLLFIVGALTTLPMVKAQEASPDKTASIPAAQPVPATPEAVFAEPITMKETKGPGASVTRFYYQGGNLILDQYLGVSPGSIGQLVFYKGAVVVDDRVGTHPISFSSRTVDSNNFKISIQSLAADDISPASLRITDPAQQIITEFFIDKTGLMRPITQAEHDADIARRKTAFEKLPPANPGAPAPPDSSPADTASTLSGGGKKIDHKLKSIFISEVNFNQADVAAVLDFLTKKSEEMDPDKEGVHFVLGDLSHVTPQDHVHRKVTIPAR